jgi:hypothetical protein
MLGPEHVSGEGARRQQPDNFQGYAPKSMLPDHCPVGNEARAYGWWKGCAEVMQEHVFVQPRR